VPRLTYPRVAQSAAACAILGLLAYRAGRPVEQRPKDFEHPWQLDAWQQGWQVGYDSENRCPHFKQAYALAWLTLHNDI